MFPDIRESLSNALWTRLRGHGFLVEAVRPSRVVKYPGGALGYFFGGYVPPGTANWHPVLKINSPKIDTLF